MSNVLKVSLQTTIYSLDERGWSQRRIARELGIDRETVGRYLRLRVKPAISTKTGTGEPSESKPAISTAGSSNVAASTPAISTAGVRTGDMGNRLTGDMGDTKTGEYALERDVINGPTIRICNPR